MDKQERSEEQARAQLESIKEMMRDLRLAEAGDDEERVEECRTRIEEDPLSIEVRGGWVTVDCIGEPLEPEDYKILLCTGGPAVRLIGELDWVSGPTTVRLEHQDWGTLWTELPVSAEDEEVLLDYAGHFYYGN